MVFSTIVRTPNIKHLQEKVCIVIINSQNYYPMCHSLSLGRICFVNIFLNMSVSLHVFIHLAELIMMFSKCWILMLTFRESEFI